MVGRAERQLRRKHLDGYASLQGEILRGEHDSHAATTDFTLERVRPLENVREALSERVLLQLGVVHLATVKARP